MRMILFEEACRICGLEQKEINHYIEEDWIRPAIKHTLEMDEEDVARIRLIQDLKLKFGVNDEGMSIILQLLDQLNRIHLEIDKFHKEEHL